MQIEKTSEIRDAFEKCEEAMKTAEDMKFVGLTIDVGFGTGAMRLSEDIEEEIAEKSELINQFMGELNIPCERDNILLSLAAKSFCKDILDEENINSYIPEFVKAGRVFHQGEIEGNPYLRNIHFETQKSGDFYFGERTISKYEFFQYQYNNSAESSANGIYIPQIAMFDHDFSYPVIENFETGWSQSKVCNSVTPQKMFTMQPSIDEAAGNVLGLGLGMGYWAYMVSEKENVNHVTIVEKSEDIINLFEKYILPQFAHKDKITIVHADAFEYMANLEDGKFDYCFAGISAGYVVQYSPYIKLKEICKSFKKTKISYWMEDALMRGLMEYVYLKIQRSLNDVVEQMPDVSQEKRYIIDYVRNLLKDAYISQPEQIAYYMNPKNILKLMSE